ncbi:hypothetical protein H310_09314 [Aphanomyces invadans]|uniref:CobW C-terminal domain-containing protein n=1 Tax=Aphanomyces invadans TaxID=157072 RepID=A0A024TVG5_9STRA|nr:hypothetical protein H310_09314 [Aphanomyces invadans]ETV98013.1 hypothetical protein H310_09314 [Aphanomyces invadans]|eukprot:XP_008873574.1 hypothetical protein H310_09314 [Aphanomyces invadans]
MNLLLIQSWIQGLMPTEGKKLLRYKGNFPIPGKRAPARVQAVVMLVQTFFTTPWATNSERTSRLVFTDRHLGTWKLEERFMIFCFAVSGPRRTSPVGCRGHDGNSCRVDCGTDVWARVDDNAFIRVSQFV